VRRTLLSGVLHERAAELGVEVRETSVGGVRQDADGVNAGGVRARWLVAADGLHSGIRRDLALGRDGRGPGTGIHWGTSIHLGTGIHLDTRFGLRRHYRTRPWSDEVEVHWAGPGEAYVTPVAEDIVGVALLTGRGHDFDEALAAFPALRERLADAPPAGPVRGAGPLRQRVRRVRSGRALLVGDAAGYVDALTGEGIAVGLVAARELVDALVADDIGRYPSRAARATRRTRLLTLGLLAVTRPAPVRAALVPAVARMPGAYAALAARVAQTPCVPELPTPAVTRPW